MKRLKLMVLAIGVAMAMLLAFSGPAGAADPPGRGASTTGLATGLANVDLQNILNAKPLEQVTLNFIAAQDPEQPGVTPGGGGVEP